MDGSAEPAGGCGPDHDTAADPERIELGMRVNYINEVLLREDQEADTELVVEGAWWGGQDVEFADRLRGLQDQEVDTERIEEEGEGGRQDAEPLGGPQEADTEIVGDRVNQEADIERVGDRVNQEADTERVEDQAPQETGTEGHGDRVNQEAETERVEDQAIQGAETERLEDRAPQEADAERVGDQPVQAIHDVAGPSKKKETARKGDMFFVLPDGKKLPAHKSVVSEASEMFAVALDERWGSKTEISLPAVTLDGAKQFIRGMYSNHYSSKVHTGLSFPLLIEVLQLSKMHMTTKLMDDCVSIIMKKIMVNNCAEAWDLSRLDLAVEFPDIPDFALTCLKKNLPDALTKEGVATWSSALWEKVLKLEGPKNVDGCARYLGWTPVPEIKLFSHLLWWRNQKPTEREDDFRTLLRFIRFPVMEKETLLSVVKPSGVLTDKDFLALTAYMDGNARQVDFICEPRTYYLATTSIGLEVILQQIDSGDCVKIGPGKYYGSFGTPRELKNISIVGEGTGTDETVLSCRSGTNGPGPGHGHILRTHLRNSRISDLALTCNCYPYRRFVDHHVRLILGLSLKGDNNILCNLKLKDCCINLEDGSGNCIRDCHIFGHRHDLSHGIALPLTVWNTKIANVTLEKMIRGIVIDKTSTNTSISNIVCNNVFHGLTLRSCGNIVLTMKYSYRDRCMEDETRKQKTGSIPTAVLIEGGSGNVVKFVDAQFESEEGSESEWSSVTFKIRDVCDWRSLPSVPARNHVVLCQQGPIKDQGTNKVEVLIKKNSSGTNDTPPAPVVTAPPLIRCPFDYDSNDDDDADSIDSNNVPASEAKENSEDSDVEIIQCIGAPPPKRIKIDVESDILF